MRVTTQDTWSPYLPCSQLSLSLLEPTAVTFREEALLGLARSSAADRPSKKQKWKLVISRSSRNVPRHFFLMSFVHYQFCLAKPACGERRTRFEKRMLSCLDGAGGYQITDSTSVPSRTRAWVDKCPIPRTPNTLTKLHRGLLGGLKRHTNR